MSTGSIDWRRGINRLYVLLWAIWTVLMLVILLLAGPDGTHRIFGIGIFFIAAVVVPALGRWALFWVIDGFTRSH